MPEEVKEQQEQEVKEENPWSEPSIDDIIEDSRIVLGEEPEPELEKTEEKPEESKAEEPEEKAEETSEKSTEETETKEEVELTPEQLAELIEKYPELKRNKEYYENYDKWEKKLRQKSQAIPFLQNITPEQWELMQDKIMPYVYGKQDLPKAPAELLDEIMEGLDIRGFNFKDEDELDIKVGADLLKPHVRQALETALNKAVPEMAALRQKLSEVTKELDEQKKYGEMMKVRSGELELDHLLSQHKDLQLKLVNDDEGILDAVNRISAVGKDHPEYNKLLKLQAVAQLADKEGWTMNKAYEQLYGVQERKTIEQKKTEEAILKNQQAGQTQETPTGTQAKPREEWEDDLEGIGDHEDKVDEMFRKHGV